MRFIVYGIGAVGGTLAACLGRAGFDVIGIARGAQLEAIRANGLHLRTPEGDADCSFPVVAGPDDIEFAADDLILMTMKSQDTEPALKALRAAGIINQTIACFQNGVANERMASRYFANVIGAVVMMPAVYLIPGEVAAIGTPKHGLFDIGRFPNGTCDEVVVIVDALNASGFAAFAHDDVMRGKYGKLLLNLANGIDSALGADARDGSFAQLVRAEARAVYKAAGIGFDDVGSNDPRRGRLMHNGDIPGVRRVGSSAAQSLARGAGSIEVDYLNGEIALLGRLHGVPTPANGFFTHLCSLLVARSAAPASMSEADVQRAYAIWLSDAGDGWKSDLNGARR